MNWDKGIKRLTWVVSVSVGGVVICLGLYEVGQSIDRNESAHRQGELFIEAVVFAIVAFCVPWVVYRTLRWVIRGFRATSEGKEGQDNE